MSGGPNQPRIDFSDLLRPPQVISKFVDEIARGATLTDPNAREETESERRQAARYQLPLRVDVQAVDDGFQLHGELYSVVAHDISSGGIGIRDTRAVESKYLAMQITGPAGESMQMLLEVLRCEKQGNVYDIGGRFVRYVDADSV